MPPTPSAYRFHAKLHVFFTFSKQPEPRSLPHSPRREFFPFEGWRTATLNLSSFNTALIDMQGTSTLDVIGGLTLNLNSALRFDSASQTIGLVTLGSGTSLEHYIDWDALLTLTKTART
ncbi:hypothetical protein [Akkermansia sp.]|uniref:hypothetical protein n=2 Tax=Akkermansia sp. TaxID=1872421 RepID=UPI0026739825|nr:hypothetical protein [Akkermansia sp.]MEE0765025.1 hypothetical protein [Akkermansia sp.]